MLPVQQPQCFLLEEQSCCTWLLSRASLSRTQQIAHRSQSRGTARLQMALLCHSDLGSRLPGGPDNQVHFEGYQVSNQCMALVRDECLLPCRDAPELGYAKESSSEQYVPDVFYKVSAGRLQKRLCCTSGNQHGRLRKGCL